MQQQQRSILLIGAGAILLLLIGGIILYFIGHKPTATEPKQNTYTDPITHETVSNPSGKTPESYGTTAGEATIFGLDKLFNQGFSTDQVDYFKSCLIDQGRLHDFKYISVDLRNLKHNFNSDTGESNYTLSIVGTKDNKQTETYGVKLDTTDISSLKVTIYSSDFSTVVKTYTEPV